MTSLKVIIALLIVVGCALQLSTACCSFHAELTKNLGPVLLNSVVVFDKATVNTCNGYNPTTGKFTAPSKGVYVFSWTILALPDKFSETILKVDGKVMGGARSNAKGLQVYLPASTTIIVEMNEGEKAWISPKYKAAEGIHSFWSTFSGYRLP